MNDQPENRTAGTDRLEDRQLAATAWHEAGHAVMAVTLGRPLLKVTIEPMMQPAGLATLGACKIRKGRSKPCDDWVEVEVLILLAGMVGESMLTGHYCQQGAETDLRKVRKLLQNRAGNERQLERLVRRMLDKAGHLLSDEGKTRAVGVIANQLLHKKTITGRAARHFIQLAISQSS